MLLKAAVIYQFLLTKYCSLEQVLLDECGTFPASFAPHNWFRNTKVQVAVSPQGLWLISATFQGARLQFTAILGPSTSDLCNSTTLEFCLPKFQDSRVCFARVTPHSSSVHSSSKAFDFSSLEFSSLEFQGTRIQFIRVPRPWISIHQNSTAFEFNSPPIPPPSISIPPNSNAPEFNAPQFHPLYPPIFPPLRHKKFNTTQIIRKASRAPFQGSVSQGRSSRLTLGNALRSPPETRQSRHRKPFQHGKHSGLRAKPSLAGALYVPSWLHPASHFNPLPIELHVVPRARHLSSSFLRVPRIL